MLPQPRNFFLTYALQKKKAVRLLLARSVLMLPGLK